MEATALADIVLDAKAFVQPLGAENAWNELGEGKFELHGHTIRIANYEAVEARPPPKGGRDEESPQPREDDEANKPMAVDLNDAVTMSPKVGDDRAESEESAPKENDDVEGAKTKTSNGGASPTQEEEGEDDEDDEDGGFSMQRQASSHHTEDDEPASPSGLPAAASPTIVFEDTITNDTPFVAKDGCLVWNSPEQNLSLCVMFVSELGFQASWSALLSLQQNPYPALEFDVFMPRSWSQLEDRDSSNMENDVSVNRPEAQLERIRSILSPAMMFKYSYVERHCISCSVIEGRLGTVRPEGASQGATPVLFSDVATCVSLLKLCHADLVEYLASDEVYPQYVTAMEYTGALPQRWECPDGLTPSSPLETTINSALRIHHLKNEVLPMSSDDEVTGILDSLLHRLQNEIVCALIADDTMLNHAVDVIKAPRVTRDEAEEEAVAVQLKFLSNLVSLTTSAFAKELVPHVVTKIFSRGLVPALADLCTNYFAPPTPTTPGVSLSANPGAGPGSAGGGSAGAPNGTGTLGSILNGSITSLGSLTSDSPSVDSNGGSTEKDKARPESTLSGADDTSPTVLSKEGGDSLPLDVASATSSTASAGGRRPTSSSSSRQSRRSRSAPKFCMPRNLEREVSHLLEETVNRLNERGEERTLCEVFRNTIVEDPERYDNFMTFLVKSQTQASPMTQNRMILFHLLGLHDDEGSSCDRDADDEAVEGKDQFHSFFIQRVLPAAVRGPPQSRARRSKETPTTPSGFLSQGLVRILEYLYINASQTNRCALSKVLFGPRSGLSRYLMKDLPVAPPIGSGGVDAPESAPAPKIQFSNSRPGSTTSAPSSRPTSSTTKGGRLTAPMRKEALLQNVRFLKAAMTYNHDQSAIVCRALSLERDVFYSYLAVMASHAHRHCMLHATMHALLQVVMTKEHLRDLRSYLALKHRALLPLSFSEYCDKEALVLLELKLRGVPLDEIDSSLAHRMSRSATPIGCMGITDTSSSSSGGKKDHRAMIDEANWQVGGSGHTMEEVQAFPSKLRSLIGSMSPTPNHSPSHSPSPNSKSPLPPDNIHHHGTNANAATTNTSTSSSHIVGMSSNALNDDPVISNGISSGGPTSSISAPSSDDESDPVMSLKKPSSSGSSSGGAGGPSSSSKSEVKKPSKPLSGSSESGSRPVPPTKKKNPHAPPLPRRGGSGGRRRSTGMSV